VAIDRSKANSYHLMIGSLIVERPGEFHIFKFSNDKKGRASAFDTIHLAFGNHH
jgi:hypothetical protein